MTRTTWQPATTGPRHRDDERAQLTLPKGTIASTTAVALGFALMATNVPATIVRDLSQAEPTTDTGQLHTITLSQPQTEVAKVHDEWIAKQANQAFKATPPAVRTEHAPAKATPTKVTTKSDTVKAAAPAARPAVKSKAAAVKTAISKVVPKKATVKKAAPKKAAHKQSVHHKAASIRTNAYFRQFNQTGNERKHNAALIIEIGKKRGFSNRSIMVAVGTAIQESGLRNLNYGDRDSFGLFQQRPSMGWGSFRQITTPAYAINKFYDRLANVRGRDSMSMMHAAMKVQIPDPYYYNRDWKWDRVATQIVKSYRA